MAGSGMPSDLLATALQQGAAGAREGERLVSEAEHRAHEVRAARMRSAEEKEMQQGGAEEVVAREASQQGVATRRPRGDWAETYAMWSDWHAEEAYQEKVAMEEKRLAASAQRAQIAGCNHDHSAERELMEKSTRVKLDECRVFREEGNAWFEEGQYFRASEKYRRVTIWLDYTFPDTDEELKEMQEVHLPALVNLAVCFLKLGDAAQAMELARRALDMDPDNLKALYCRAKANRLEDKFEEASVYLKRALALDSENFELRKEAALLRNKASRYREDSKLRAQAMFRGAGNAERAQLLRIG
ncbi:Peptidyl-prolyl cis-trans isomerase FKBP5 [Hondaea fermentalgiana]|uniref:peptidylprolyl isomerase n=1 Tax=Hondaea fermentalgiana TaxID=2315210 RepID=A0A2R5G3C9_9STRA|nr:Peptidyl-prolyl cis-trans isomerase FKBP5 [Hondaea fermentalgiana]|eukprot:GBG24248.1 Peptidyl-prolyl cis-trans isomerase FKBP5 [Hondaea fermentalgiana]